MPKENKSGYKRFGTANIPNGRVCGKIVSKNYEL
jgi:hypothetical protein